MKTSYYSNLKHIDTNVYVPIAISGDEGKLVGFTGRAMRKLSPYSFFIRWKARENQLQDWVSSFKITDEEYRELKQENQQNYIISFYNQVLKKLNPNAVYEELGENAVMLCFEKPTDFCHRFLVAGWLELSLGIEIDELGFENNLAVRENKNRLKNEIAKLMEQENKPKTSEQNQGE